MVIYSFHMTCAQIDNVSGLVHLGKQHRMVEQLPTKIKSNQASDFLLMLVLRKLLPM